jgi:hypothetical protein
MMAAGQGFKTFTTGEVLTAGDVNGYLMQGINVFATTTARDAAITAPAEGQFAFTKDTNSLWYYDGAAWVASGATGDIEGVTAGVGISGGGTSGTVTVTNSMATEIAAKGDLIVGTGSQTFDNLTVGANDTILTADSTTATGLKWASPAGGALSFSLLNSGGTSLSGTTTTISGISDKSVIMVLVNNASSDTAGDVVEVRVNGTTTNLYSQKGIQLIGYSPYDIGMLSGGGGMTQSGIQIGQGSSNAACVLQGSVIIQGCNSTGGKAFTSVGSFNNGGSNSMIGFSNNGFINITAAITSVSVKLEQGNFDAGQVYVYAA